MQELALTGAGLGGRMPKGLREWENGWTPLPAKAICEPGKECRSRFTVTVHGPIA